MTQLIPQTQTHLVAPGEIDNNSSLSEKMDQLTQSLITFSSKEVTKNRVKLLSGFGNTDANTPLSREEFEHQFSEIRKIEGYKNTLYNNLFEDLEKQYINFSGKLLIQVPLSHAADFIPKLIEKKSKPNSIFSKIQIEYIIIDPESIKDVANNEGEVTQLYDGYLEKVRQSDKFIQIVDTAAGNSTFVDENNTSAKEEVNHAYKDFLAEINKMGAKSGGKKLRLYFPTKEMADKEGMNEAGFYELYANATSLDWERIEQANEELAELIREYDSVHIKGKGTDISFDISDMGARNSVIQTNWPGSEVHTAPQRAGVNGIIAYNESIYIKMLDVKIPGITFEFKNGRMENFNIHGDQENKDTLTRKLEEIFNKSESNRYLGELAFGTNFHVPTGIVHPLIGEKALGMHIAFGNSYYYDGVDNGNNKGGGNEATIHWDVIKNMKGSTISFSKKDGSKIEIMNDEKFNPHALPKLASYQNEIDSQKHSN